MFLRYWRGENRQKMGNQICTSGECITQPSQYLLYVEISVAGTREIVALLSPVRPWYLNPIKMWWRNR